MADTDYCAVCAEPLAWVAAGPCGHTEVCHRCCARLRLVLKDTRCALCKQARGALRVHALACVRNPADARGGARDAAAR
jgi:hypothetical protein